VIFTFYSVNQSTNRSITANLSSGPVLKNCNVDYTDGMCLLGIKNKYQNVLRCHLNRGKLFLIGHAISAM